jgi:hypothetical protein
MFEVYSYAGLYPLNVAGITDEQYVPTKLARNLGGLLLNISIQNLPGMSETLFNQKYLMNAGGYDHTGLRMLLADLRVPYWVELTAGYCLRVFRGLDVYMKVELK